MKGREKKEEGKSGGLGSLVGVRSQWSIVDGQWSMVNR